MVTAQKTTETLRGHWYGRYGTAPCPICQPDARPGQNALTLTDGAKGLLAHCKKAGCDFRDLAAALGIRPCAFAAPDAAVIARREAERQAEADKRARQAWALWDGAEPIRGTIAETYLRRRAITCTLPETLRFHPECWHGPTARCWPALVARVDGGDGFAVHRTFLRPDGSAKADVPQGTSKMMLGACAGGAVRLAGGQDALAVAEGIETALSLLCGPLHGCVAVWAALSTSGMAGLGLPVCSGHLIIATDSDDRGAGQAAGHKLAKRAADFGWAATMFPAPEGRDWNDVLQSMKGATA